MGTKSRNYTLYEPRCLAPLIATISAVLAALITGSIWYLAIASFDGYEWPGMEQVMAFIVSIPVGLFIGICCWGTVFIIVIAFRRNKRDRTILIDAFIVALWYSVFTLLVLALLILYGEYIYPRI